MQCDRLRLTDPVDQLICLKGAKDGREVEGEGDLVQVDVLDVEGRRDAHCRTDTGLWK